MVDPRRTRVRFADLEYDETPDGRCTVRVHLEWKGRKIVGSASGTQIREGKILAAGRAAVQAVAEATDGRLSLSLLGIKAVRAFDGWAIIASVIARSPERSYKLLGAQTCDEDEGGGTVRAAVLTILDATNRIVEKHMADDDS